MRTTHQSNLSYTLDVKFTNCKNDIVNGIKLFVKDNRVIVNKNIYNITDEEHKLLKKLLHKAMLTLKEEDILNKHIEKRR